AAPEVHRLEERRLAAVEEWLEAALAAGRAGEVVAELEALVRRHPLREGLHGLLMRALYESGRQADALGAFQSARRVLVEELGIDPSPQLQELQARILRQEVARPQVASAEDEEHFRGVAAALLSGRLVPVLGTDAGRIAERL